MLDSLARKVNRLEPEGKKRFFFFILTVQKTVQEKSDWPCRHTPGSEGSISASWQNEGIYTNCFSILQIHHQMRLLVVPLLHIIKQTLITLDAQTADRSLEEKKKNLFTFPRG